jgi:hypothetical protein
VIKLICPHCMKPVPVPDDFAGREVTCPSCSKTFEAPARYNPAVLGDPPPPPPVAPPPAPPPAPPTAAVPPPPPVAAPEYSPPAAPAGYAPPTPPTVPTEAAVAPPTPTPAGYTRSCGITISPRVVAWLPAIFLTITFVCTFFSWIGAYFGGSPAYWQSPWRALVGRPGSNPVYVQYMPGDGAWFNAVPADVGLMLPFLFLLIVALVFAWADRALPSSDSRIASRLATLWPWRKTLIASTAGLALVFVVIQVASGFGMERAIRKSVRDNPEIAKAREEAAGAPSKETAVDNRVDAEIAKFNLERTWWQDIAVYSLIAAVLAVLLLIVLDRRGTRPPPRIVLHY